MNNMQAQYMIAKIWTLNSVFTLASTIPQRNWLRFLIHNLVFYFTNGLFQLYLIYMVYKHYSNFQLYVTSFSAFRNIFMNFISLKLLSNSFGNIWNKTTNN